MTAIDAIDLAKWLAEASTSAFVVASVMGLVFYKVIRAVTKQQAEAFVDAMKAQQQAFSESLGLLHENEKECREERRGAESLLFEKTGDLSQRVSALEGSIGAR